MDNTIFFIESVKDSSLSDWINVVSLIVNSFLAIWIVRSIQKNQTNKRVLKDHFITEIKDVRSEYKEFLNKLYSNRLPPKTIIPWFKLMNIKTSGIMAYLNEFYRLDKNKLSPYQIKLNSILTNNIDYISQFNESYILLSEQSKQEFMRFEKEHNGLFLDIIVSINNY